MKTKLLLLRLLSDYGMIFVLIGLCVFFSVATWQDQYPSGAEAARQVAGQIRSKFGNGVRVMIAARPDAEDTIFATTLAREVELAGGFVGANVKGEPSDAREALSKLGRGGAKIDVIATSQAAAGWLVFTKVDTEYPMLGRITQLRPHAYRGSNFLKSENLLNIANQIAVIAIIAVGMTVVIVSGGIDLSVGSLIALSAVVTSRVIRDYCGGVEAGIGGLFFAGLVGVLACGGIGAFSGAVVTLCGIPSFIVTLATMLVASGLAYLLSAGQSIYQVPDNFVWLGRGADLFGLPNAVLLVILLYAAAHVLMTFMKLGRYLYAVGGNAEAARLSGVPVNGVVTFAFVVSGLLAGLGGVVMASQLKSGSPTYGGMYELYVIAAVVVGGTSLRGGSGKMLGTLIGALIIAVIQNGMNLCGVESYTQKVVLGLVILAAVLLDRLRQRLWNGPTN